MRIKTNSIYVKITAFQTIFNVKEINNWRYLLYAQSCKEEFWFYFVHILIRSLYLEFNKYMYNESAG